MLIVKLFGGETLTMNHLVQYTDLTQQTVKKIIKNINDECEIIKIDQTGKPYQYTLDLDAVSQIEC